MEPVGGAVGPIYDVEWYRIMDAFRQSHAEREKVMRDYPEDQLLDQLLLTLRAEVRDDSPEEVLKCNLLVFLQENVMYFLAEDAQSTEKVCAQLNSILNHIGESNGLIFIKCNVLATLTTILLELELIRTQPRVFESFVEVLFDIISHINSPADRVLRAAACDCLRELALTYPKLLTKSLGHLYNFCQQEVSHAVQSYLGLFSSAFVSCSSAIFEDPSAQLQGHDGVDADDSASASASSSSLSSPFASTSSLPSLAAAPPSPFAGSSYINYGSSSSYTLMRGGENREWSLSSGGGERTSSSAHLSMPGASLLSVVAPLCPFHIPEDVQLRPLAYPSQSAASTSVASASAASSLNAAAQSSSVPLLHIPDAFLRDVRRSVSLLVESAPRVTDWGLATILEQLITFVARTDLPRDVFKHYFFHYLYTNSLVMLHAVVTIMLRFPEVMQTGDYRKLIDQLFRLVDEPLLSTERRIMVIEWLTSLERFFPDALVYHLMLPESPPPSPSAPRRVGDQPAMSSPPSAPADAITPAMRQSLPPLLFQYYNRFYPVIFDSWELREAKLLALCSCFNADTAVPPPTILRVLACVEEYRFYASAARPTVIAFRVLSAMLLSFTELYAEIYKYLLNLILHMPKFLPNVIKLINDIKDSPIAATSKVAAVLLSSLNEVFATHPINRLAQYLSILEPIVSEPSIDPTNLLRKVLQFLKQTNYCQQGKWNEGDSVLAISRAALLTHPTRLVFKPLGEVLLFCVHNYADVDIRDRAYFYYQLLTHVSSDRLRTILTPLSDLQAEDEEKTIGMQTTHLPKIPVLTYPLHSQLSLARRPAGPQLSPSVSPASSPVQQHSDSEAHGEGTRSAIDEARGKNEAEERKRSAEEEERRRDEAAREAEEKLFRDYYARVVADSANADAVDAGDACTLTQQQRQRRPSFTLDFTLRFKTEAEQLRDVSTNHHHSMMSTDASALTGKTLPAKLYTLVLSFAPSRLYEPLASVHIPYLCRGEDAMMTSSSPSASSVPSLSSTSSGFAVPRRRGRWANASGEAEAPPAAAGGEAARFPYVYDVTIAFRPLAPLPASFAVNATFNDREGHICEGQMEPLHVHFTDLFLPLPLASSSSSLSSSSSFSSVSTLSTSPEEEAGDEEDSRVEGAAAPLAGDALLRAMWRQLWRRVGLPGLGVSSSAAESHDDREESGRSVKYLAKGREVMTRIIHRHFGRFIVPQDPRDDDSDDGEEGGDADAVTVLRVMIFLPPRYHLLVKAKMQRDATILDIRTDFWRVLPYVDPLFDSLCASP